LEVSGCELLVSAASPWEIGTKWRIGCSMVWGHKS
jgi:PIN domain nuclease of toxin-antitoxin system